MCFGEHFASASFELQASIFVPPTQEFTKPIGYFSSLLSSLPIVQHTAENQRTLAEVEISSE